MVKLKSMLSDGTVAANNSNQKNDTSAACLVAAEVKLCALNLHSMDYLVGWTSSGCNYMKMGIGPVPVVSKLSRRTGLSFDQIDRVKLNETFSLQALAVLVLKGKAGAGMIWTALT